MGVNKEFPLPLISTDPAIQIFVEFSSNNDVICKLLKILKEISEPERVYLAMVKERGKFRAAGILKAKDEKELKEMIRKIRERLKEIKGAEFEIYEMENYGKGYIMVEVPRITLFGERLIMFRESRFMSYIRRIAEILGSGGFSFMRSLGAEDGIQIFKMHKDHIEDLFSRGFVGKIVKYLMMGLYHLGNIPEFDLEERGREIVVKIGKIEDGDDLKSYAIHYLYGIFHSIFYNLGTKPQEFAKESKIAGMSIKTKKGEYVLRIL